jgi:hypothetical protein
MSPRRTRRGDTDAVAEQGLGLELGEVEVGPPFLQGDYELGGISAELDGGDPVPGCKLGEKARCLSEQSIICAGQLHIVKRTPVARRAVPPRGRTTVSAADALAVNALAVNVWAGTPPRTGRVQVGFPGLLCTTDAPRALVRKGRQGSPLVRLTGSLTCGFVRSGRSAGSPAQT